MADLRECRLGVIKERSAEPDGEPRASTDVVISAVPSMNETASAFAELPRPRSLSRSVQGPLGSPVR